MGGAGGHGSRLAAGAVVDRVGAVDGARGAGVVAALAPAPAPDPAYLRFRLQTAYGDPSREPEPADVVGYLKWCRSMRGLAR
jgi:hypothetical protein